jgi:hypothetical protein
MAVGLAIWACQAHRKGRWREFRPEARDRGCPRVRARMVEVREGRRGVRACDTPWGKPPHSGRSAKMVEIASACDPTPIPSRVCERGAAGRGACIWVLTVAHRRRSQRAAGTGGTIGRPGWHSSKGEGRAFGSGCSDTGRNSALALEISRGSSVGLPPSKRA